MKKHYILLDLCLSLFDGGAAAGSGGGAGAAASAGEGASTTGGTQATPAVAGQGKKTGGSPKVLYGKQPAPAVAGEQGAAGEEAPPATEEGQTGGQAGAATQPSTEEKRKAYRALMDGEYKQFYAEDTQRIINQRFRETKNLEEQLQRHQPLIDMLMQRYKIADGDMGKLQAAVESDDAYWSEAAEEAGMSVEQYKQFQKLQRDNAALLEAQRRTQSQQAAQQQLQKWYAEAEEVKGVYPSFDINAEVKNQQFLSMLRSGVPMQHAFEVIHMDEIKAGVAALQAKATEKQVVAGIRAKGARPAENGTAAQSAFIVKDDVTKLTKQDRAEIARRAARGENITF